MATKKPAARAPKATPARAPSRPAPRAAAAPRTAPADGSVVLVHQGGATLNFRDGSGAKRRVLRGVPFTVDADTASLLLRTDASVSIAEAEESSPVPVTSVTTPVEPVVGPDGDPGVPDVPTPNEVAPPPPGPGAITLGDLPPSAKIGGS